MTEIIIEDVRIQITGTDVLRIMVTQGAVRVLRIADIMMTEEITAVHHIAHRGAIRVVTDHPKATEIVVTTDIIPIRDTMTAIMMTGMGKAVVHHMMIVNQDVQTAAVRETAKKPERKRRESIS